MFLDGNGLPDAFSDLGAGRSEFTICETGFGTGLNFLAVWKLFEDAAREGQSLHYISFEKYPLSADQIDEVLSHWAELENYREKLAAMYDMAGGVFAMINRVKLTLIIGDVNTEMPKLDANVDAWFLDGFKPSSNPEMWSDTVFSNMARLSHSGSTLATFTSAGFVRRGLQAAGFEIKKVAGYGRKREMVVGRMP